MASHAKAAQKLARQLFKMSVVDGAVSAERVEGVLAYVEKHRPANPVMVLKAYQRLVATELAKGEAVVEHVGAVNGAMLSGDRSRDERAVRPPGRRDRQAEHGPHRRPARAGSATTSTNHPLPASSRRLPRPSDRAPIALQQPRQAEPRTLSMSTVLEQIEQQIAKLSSKAVKKNTGNIRTVADGVAKIDGLSDVMYNEMVQFPGGAIGIALNLEEDEVGCVILGDIAQLKEGDEVTTTGKLLSVPVGKALLGRTVDALGSPVDGKGPIDAKETYPVERIAPGIIVRKSVSQPLFTGIMAIDSMIPIGRGQRELIIGDRGTGKTTITIDTIINQAKINKVGLASGDPKFRPVYSIYVAIGQKNSNIVRTISALEAAGALEFTIIVAAPAADNPANQYIAPYSGAAMGEWFMENGMDALIVYDDLSKHAVAYRQISLILKRPSGPRGVPGRRVLPPQPPPRARGAPRRQGLADRASHHRDPRGRRLGLHSDERDLDHGRPDLPRDGPLQPGHPARRLGGPLGLPRRARQPRSRRPSRSAGS